MKKLFSFIFIFLSVISIYASDNIYILDNIYYHEGDFHIVNNSFNFPNNRELWKKLPISTFTFSPENDICWFMIDIPQNQINNPYLYIYNLAHIFAINNTNFEIYSGNSLIYSYGKIHTLNYLKANPDFFIELPENNSNILFIRIETTKLKINLHSRLLYGAKNVLTKFQLFKNIDSILISFFAIFGFIVIIPFFSIFHRKREKDFFSVIFFISGIAFYYSTKCQLLYEYIFPDNKNFIYSFNIIGLMMILVSILFFSEKFFDKSIKKYIRFMIYTELLYGTISFFIRLTVYGSFFNLINKNIQLLLVSIEKNLFFHHETFIVIVFSVIMFIISTLTLKTAKQQEFKIFYIGLSILIITFLNDAVVSLNIFNYDFLLSKYGIFIFSVILLFSYIFITFKRIDKYAVELNDKYLELNEINRIQSYFIPSKCLELLESKDISEFILSKNTKKNLTITFIDIRNFTTLSESMAPQENFNFLNEYLKVIVPIIHNYNGLIHKFVGDGTITIFENQLDAINAAIEINEKLKHTEIMGNIISVGISVNSGNVMIGIIGEEMRREFGVISDTVDITIKMQHILKYFETSLIISANALDSIKDNQLLSYRFIGIINISGKKEPITVYEILDHRIESIANVKRETREIFENGVQLFISGETGKAKDIFRQLFFNNPLDGAVRRYLELCENKET